jgi:hypothetical protein
MNHDQGICTGWRVDRSGQKHKDHRQREREKIDPRRVAQNLKACNSDQRSTKMAAEKGSRLHGGGAGKSEQEYGRSPEGSNQ